MSEKKTIEELREDLHGISWDQSNDFEDEISSLKDAITELGKLRVLVLVEELGKVNSERYSRTLQAKLDKAKEYMKHKNDAERLCEALKHSDYACTCGFEQTLKDISEE